MSKKDTGTGSSASTSRGGDRPLLRTCLDALCGCQIDRSEYLEVDTRQTARDKWGGGIPRIRSPGEYYIDPYNDEPWTYPFGTGEENGIWMNSGHQAGSIMATLGWSVP